MISILIAEDQSMVLGALAALLALEPDFEIVGTVENGVAGGSGLLSEVRRVQQMTALTQAVTANPKSESARDGLATTLTELGYLDGALGERAGKPS